MNSAWTYYHTQKSNKHAARLTGTNFTYREGAYGLEVYQGRTCLGTWPAVWSAQKACVVGFLQAPTTTIASAIPVLERVLSDPTALFLLKNNFGQDLKAILVTLEQGAPVRKDQINGGLLPSQYCEAHGWFHACLISDGLNPGPAT